MEDNIVINFNWLKLEDYQFKILILVKMLATDKEQLTYKGKLENMRNWLDLGNSTANNTKIRNAIQELYKKGIIDYTPKSNTATKYTITIIDKIENDVFSIVRKVDKQDIETIRKYTIDNNKRILGNMLKIYIFALGNTEIITYANLGLLLNIITKEDVNNNGEYKINKISNSINSLEQCNFKDNTIFEKKRKWFTDTTEKGQITYAGRGTEIRVIKQFK